MDERSQRLRRAREEAGFETAAQAAERFGWNPNTYKSNENGNAPFSFRKAKDYAKAFNVRAEWLYDALGPARDEPPRRELSSPQPGQPVSLSELRDYLQGLSPSPKPAPTGRYRRIDRQIPVVGEVAAGVWREAAFRQPPQWEEYIGLEVQGYERATLRALKVVGPSMNLIYPEGRYVVIADPAEAGLRVGDHVVVERHKADLVEITLKEFVQDEQGRIALWPRSSHPDFQTPIYLKGYEEEDQTAPLIVGVVVADYGKRERPPLLFERA